MLKIAKCDFYIQEVEGKRAPNFEEIKERLFEHENLLVNQSYNEENIDDVVYKYMNSKYGGDNIIDMSRHMYESYIRFRTEESILTGETKLEIYNKYTDKILVTVDSLDEVEFINEPLWYDRSGEEKSSKEDIEETIRKMNEENQENKERYEKLVGITK